MKRFVREVRRRVASSVEWFNTEIGERCVEAGRRWVPELRRRVGRVRQQVIAVGLGVALVVPGAAMLVQGESASAEATDGGSSASESLASQVAAAKASEGEVASAWRAKAMERALEPVADRFARQYGIPRSLAREITVAAQEFGIEPRVAFGLVRTESSFRRTVSRRGVGTRRSRRRYARGSRRTRGRSVRHPHGSRSASSTRYFIDK